MQQSAARPMISMPLQHVLMVVDRPVGNLFCSFFFVRNTDDSTRDHQSKSSALHYCCCCTTQTLYSAIKSGFESVLGNFSTTTSFCVFIIKAFEASLVINSLILNIVIFGLDGSWASQNS